jgi:hypothetical protein
MLKLNFGWKAGTEQYPPGELLEYAVAAEAAGFDSIDIKFAQRYVDLGFDHLIFHSAGPDQRAFIEDYGREVLPRLRQRLSGSRPVDSAASESFRQERNVSVENKL